MQNTLFWLFMISKQGTLRGYQTLIYSICVIWKGADFFRIEFRGSKKIRPLFFSSHPHHLKCDRTLIWENLYPMLCRPNSKTGNSVFPRDISVILKVEESYSHARYLGLIWKQEQICYPLTLFWLNLKKIGKFVILYVYYRTPTSIWKMKKCTHPTFIYREIRI